MFYLRRARDNSPLLAACGYRNMACHEQIKSSPLHGELFMRRVVEAAGVEPVDYRMNKGLTGCWYHLGTTKMVKVPTLI
jgi:hypothetical protein